MKGRVLIADDELSLLKCVAAFLEAKNFEVQAVPSATRAIAALASAQFDVVLTDMAMETQTAGYDVARAAQSQSYEPDVVVFTSFHIAASEWKERGVKKLFTKGDVGIATVSDAISNIMAERTRRRALLSTGMN